jgi:hypothetical protein
MLMGGKIRLTGLFVTKGTLCTTSCYPLLNLQSKSDHSPSTLAEKVTLLTSTVDVPGSNLRGAWQSSLRFLVVM